MSFGIKLGRGIGAVGALAVHGVLKGVENAGTFGADVVQGVGEGYDAKTAFLALSPEQRKALVETKRAEIAAQRRAPIEVKARRAKATAN
jgi:hypothetical protein